MYQSRDVSSFFFRRLWRLITIITEFKKKNPTLITELPFICIISLKFVEYDETIIPPPTPT